MWRVSHLLQCSLLALPSVLALPQPITPHAPRQVALQQAGCVAFQSPPGISPVPDGSLNPKDFDYNRYDIPKQDGDVDSIVKVLEFWQSMAEKIGVDTSLPMEGLVWKHPPTLYELHVSHPGDSNQLLYFNVFRALGVMLDYYNTFPKNVGTIVPLSEVHVVEGFVLKGFITLTGKDTACGQAIHLDATGQLAPYAVN